MRTVNVVWWQIGDDDRGEHVEIAGGSVPSAGDRVTFNRARSSTPCIVDHVRWVIDGPDEQTESYVRQFAIVVLRPGSPT